MQTNETTHERSSTQKPREISRVEEVALKIHKRHKRAGRERDLAEGISAKDENVEDGSRETRFFGESRAKKKKKMKNYSN